MPHRWIIALSILTLAGVWGCGAKTFKSATGRWSATNLPVLVRYIWNDTIPEQAKIRRLREVAELQCLIDRDTGRSSPGDLSGACRCTRPPQVADGGTACREWARAVTGAASGER